MRSSFPRIAIVDGSTPEAVRKQTQTLRRQDGVALAAPSTIGDRGLLTRAARDVRVS